LFVCLLFFSAGCGLASSFFCVWWKVKVGSFALARKPLVSDESYPSAMQILKTRTYLELV